MTTFMVVLTGFLVRFALPILVMVVVVSILRSLDARWQAEARRIQKLAAEDTSEHFMDLRNCAIDEVAANVAFESTEPCWQAFRKSNGYLHEECLHCKVFRAAPVLIPNHQ